MDTQHARRIGQLRCDPQVHLVVNQYDKGNLSEQQALDRLKTNLRNF